MKPLWEKAGLGIGESQKEVELIESAEAAFAGMEAAFTHRAAEFVEMSDGEPVLVVDETTGDDAIDVVGRSIEVRVPTWNELMAHTFGNSFQEFAPERVVGARADRLLERALGWLPHGERERCAEEWRADLLELAGDDRGQWKHALGLLWSALALRRDSRRSAHAARRSADTSRHGQ